MTCVGYFLSRSVALGRGGECACECGLTIDGPVYEVFNFECGGYILLLSYMLRRSEYLCVVATANERV